MVENGTLPVVVGWHTEKIITRSRSREESGGLLSGFEYKTHHMLYVLNDTVSQFEDTYPQLKEEVERWTSRVKKFDRASKLCSEARHIMFSNGRYRTYSLEGGIRLRCHSSFETALRREIASSYEKKIREKEKEIEELKARENTGTPLSRSRWLHSLETGCAAVAHAVASGCKWHRVSSTQQEDFHTLMQRMYKGEDNAGPHAEAEAAAWKALPPEYKVGVGNPAKKKASQTPETSNTQK